MVSLTAIRRARPGIVPAALAATTLVVAACGSGSGEPPAVRVTSALVAPGEDTTAAYVTLVNEGGDDRLLAAASPAADRVVLHETVEQDGLLLMRRADGGFEVPGGGELALMPGGAHLMLEGLATPLEPGDRVALELDLSETGRLTADAEVVPQIELNERLLPGDVGS